MSKAIRVRVENGRLVGEAPAGLPEGTELDLQIADPDDDLSDDDVEALNGVIEKSVQELEAGRGIPADEVMRRLRSR